MSKQSNSLKRAGASVTEKPVPVFDRSAEYFKGGGYAGAEAYAIHRKNADRLGDYDPRVAKRVLLGKDLSAADYVDFNLMRAQFQREVEALMAPFDAFLLPTVPCLAPPIAEVNASDESYFRWNGRLLRLVGLVNFLDGCAVSLPCQPRGDGPVGLMVSGPAMSDRRILSVAAAVERRACPGLTGAPRGAVSTGQHRRTARPPASRRKSRPACSSASTTSGSRRGASSTLPAGRRARALGKRYPGAQVIALDFALQMLKPRGSRWFRKSPLLVCADLERLPLAAEAIDFTGATWRCTGSRTRCRRCASSRACWCPRAC